MCFSLSALSQDCKEGLQVNFKVGEVLEYELVYNWGLIWARAGAVRFSVKDTIINGASLWNLKGYGTSAKHWDWFYKVRANYESIAHTDLSPWLFERTGQEGSNLYNRDYKMKGEKCQFSFLDDEGVVRYKTFSIPACSFDVMTAIYYCRSIPFDNFEIDEAFPLNLILDGTIHESYVRYKGKEIWVDPNTGKKYDCIKFKPLLIDGTVFSEGESMTVWVTDDINRIPVYVETDLVVGKAKVFLTKYELGN